MKFFIVLLSVFSVAFCAVLPRIFNAHNSAENIAKLSVAHPTENVELLSGQIEGDMVLDQDQMDALQGKSGRTGLINDRYRWTNEIAYVLSSVFSSAQSAAIIEGLAEIEQRTCLRFVPRTTQTDYISVIGNGSGCWSQVGRRGGMQELHLQLYAPGSGCFRHGTIIHEFIHALGFYHMQSAYDRDDYVEIVWENIQAGTENNFAMHSQSTVTHFGEGYEYGSVMHYPAVSFSINGLPTIIPHDPNAEIGQRYEVTDKDIARINTMYGC